MVPRHTGKETTNKRQCYKRIIRQKDRIIDDYRGNDSEEKNERKREREEKQSTVSLIDRRTKNERKLIRSKRNRKMVGNEDKEGPGKRDMEIRRTRTSKNEDDSESH